MPNKEERLKLSLNKQIGNIWSEVSRMLKAKNSWNQNRLWDSFVRMMDLWVMTAENLELSQPFRKEFGRAKEILIDYCFGDNIYGSNDKNIQLWYDQFVV